MKFLGFLIMIFPLFAFTQISQSDPNKDLIKHFYEKVYKDWNMELVDELISPEFVSHDWPKDLKGPEGFKSYYTNFKKSIPNATYEVKDLIAEGDRVTVRWEMTGSYQNSFPGIDIPPTGQKIVLKGVAIYRIKNEKLAERWVISDIYGLLKKVQQKPKPNSSSKIKPVKQGYVPIDRLKMYYEIYGKGDPLVLIHGSFQTIPLNWSDFIPKLAENFQVIAAEMQGHGRTKDIPRALSFENMADDVSALLDHLQINQANIIGYSMGGGVAFQMGIRHPDQVRKLVILSGAYSSKGWHPEVEEALAQLTSEQLEESDIHKEYLHYGNNPDHFSDFIEKVLAIDLRAYDWQQEVKAIEKPLFLVLGDNDGLRQEHFLKLFTSKGGGKTGEIHGISESRMAILPGTSHSNIVKRADMLVPMITEFISTD